MTMVEQVTDQELLRCRDCRTWDPENQPSVLAELERTNGQAYADRWFIAVKSGVTMNFGFGDIPLWTELIVCDTHEEAVKARV
jgi:hypothetical protein